MDSIGHFKRLFAFEEWAQYETLASLEAIPSPPPKTVNLLAHQLGAGFLWLARIRNTNSPLAVWPELKLVECRARSKELAREWRAYLDALSEAELARSVAYINSQGQSWTDQVADILTHVVFHGTHHRGQIALELRAAGARPAYVDFIHGTRNALF